MTWWMILLVVVAYLGFAFALGICLGHLFKGSDRAPSS